ncbi:MAG: L,D-transpeptidase family protein [Clostridiales bacterium]|nr:L,D-transpeptidase family protein [Clostridiales bacterium]
MRRKSKKIVKNLLMISVLALIGVASFMLMSDKSTKEIVPVEDNETVVEDTQVPEYTQDEGDTSPEAEIKPELDNLQELEKMVKSSEVIAVMIKDSALYSDYSDSKEIVGEISIEEKVEILRDRGCQWYYVKNLDTLEEGWIPVDTLSIPEDPQTNNELMTKEQLEAYVNFKAFESNSEYFIWVDIDRQVTNVFIGEKGKWELVDSMLSATGKNISPTTRGKFEVSTRGDWFYTERFASGAKYWTKFNGAYLFHSVSMDINKEVSDPTLGIRASNGCIRLAVENAKWIYDNIPEGTAVFIN